MKNRVVNIFSDNTVAVCTVPEKESGLAPVYEIFENAYVRQGYINYAVCNRDTHATLETYLTSEIVFTSITPEK